MRLLIGGEGIGGGGKAYAFMVLERGDALTLGILVCDFERREVTGVERGEGEPAGVSCGDKRELMSIVFKDCYYPSPLPSTSLTMPASCWLPWMGVTAKNSDAIPPRLGSC